MNVETRDGLVLEVAGRELTDGLVVAQPHRRRDQYLYAVPAVLLIALLVVPMVWTFGWALDADVPVVGNFRALFTDPVALRSAWHSLLWVGIALVLIGFGYCVAVLSRQLGRLWRVLLYVLILPFGVSAVVSGAVFRLIFDPTPERGMATALFGGNVTWLGPDLIWWVLASAFAWSWLGFIVVLFRAGLDSAGGATFRLWRFVLPKAGSVTAIVVLTVLVAAIRVFDLVLIVAPGSIQDDVDIVGLHWWRMTLRSADTGGPSALAVLLFAVVAVLSLAGMRAMRRGDGAKAVPLSIESIDDSRPARWWSWPLVGGVGLLWIMPVLVLVLTAFHSPESAGSVGWWRFDPFSLDSFAATGATWLWPAVAGSFLIAGLAAALVLVAAVPLAYLLTWVAPRRLARVVTGLLAILAVAPVQMYVGPLRAVFTDLGLAGGRAPLALVHAAAGLPFATLVLRTAFLAAPARDGRPALDGMWRRGPYRTALIAAGVLEFVLVWNDFIVGFLISGSGSGPLTRLPWGEARQFGTSAGTVAAAAVVSAVVPVVLLLATWRRVVVGLTGGIGR
ncbi:sugar ABC transporter permease [Actinophytocola oryzae]|uniref:Alpha-glucoside transport system permease protein n=1 Tax=Actinophytocola oryzae TaxID=502181 RepID=A0A4R7UZY2_9PSEU|nr:sugar ABC transporter permease [Actinophytocola oryzae]TDV41767.1 alpha-glucoside transport system permease protein [Actinophytocola oryzae]